MARATDDTAAAAAFAEAAAQYCRLIDGLRKGKRARFYARLEAVLSELHRTILPLRAKVAGVDRSEGQSRRMDHKQWQKLAGMIGKAVGPDTVALFKWYRQTPGNDGWVEWKGTRIDMLDDDLADIYRDVHDGLCHWRTGVPSHRVEAVWIWRFHFESHWGEHLFNAMMTTHAIRYIVYGD